MTDKLLHTETFSILDGNNKLSVEHQFFDNGDCHPDEIYENIFIKLDSISASFNVDVFHTPNWRKTLVDISNKVTEVCTKGSGNVRMQISDKTEILYTIDNHEIVDNQIVLHNYFNIAKLRLKGKLTLTPSILMEMANCYKSGRERAARLTM